MLHIGVQIRKDVRIKELPPHASDLLLWKNFYHNYQARFEYVDMFVYTGGKDNDAFNHFYFVKMEEMECWI